MKRTKNYLGILMMLTLLVGFTSCESDEDLFDRVNNYVWVGDLGFYYNSYELDSQIYLGSNGFGSDEQVYYDNGQYFGSFDIRWDIQNGSLYIDYGNVAAPRELRNMYVSGGRMSGALYIDGIYYGDVVLYRD